MRARFFVALTLALAVFPVAAQTPPALPVGAEAVEAKLMTKVGPQTRAWIKQTAASQRGSMLFSEGGAAQMVRANPALAGLGNGDTEALAFLVLMETARSVNEDTKTMIEQVKQINSAKDGLRQTNARSKVAAAGLRSGAQTQAVPRVTQNVARVALQPVPVPKPEFDARLMAAKANLDSLNDMGEMESLRLQMAMDRMSKFMSTLSNLLKKVSDTGATITQNLK